MAKELDFDAIKAAAESHRADMTRFLRAMISHPSESCEEGEVVACIKAEMESLGYDEVKVDGLGNVMGFMGEGDKIIAIARNVEKELEDVAEEADAKAAIADSDGSENSETSPNSAEGTIELSSENEENHTEVPENPEA